jgi:hypothetical protein
MRCRGKGHSTYRADHLDPFLRAVAHPYRIHGMFFVVPFPHVKKEAAAHGASRCSRPAEMKCCEVVPMAGFWKPTHLSATSVKI